MPEQAFEQYQQYFQADWLSQKIGHSVKKVEVKERPLFASGDSRLWHITATITDNSHIDLYGKYLRHAKATDQTGLLEALTTDGLNCPQVLFVSEDNHFYLYRSVVGSILVDELDNLKTEELVGPIIDLVGQLHASTSAVDALKPIDLDTYQHQLEKSLATSQQILPTQLTAINRAGEFARSHLEALAGPTPTHGDLNPWNIIVDSGRLGLIDFSQAVLSVPELDWGTFLSSLDFLAATNSAKETAALTLRDQLRSQLIEKGVQSELLRASYDLASLTHLWVIGAYGLEIDKGRALAEHFWQLSILGQ